MYNQGVLIADFMNFIIMICIFSDTQNFGFYILYFKHFKTLSIIVFANVTTQQTMDQKFV